ncbi:MAG: GGDEF domain-containing protein [Gammaproteobacteria bacterium]
MNYLARRTIRTFILLAASFALMGMLATFLIRDTADYFIERQAVAVADIVVTLSKTARSIYSKAVVKKLQEDGTGSSVDYVHKPGFIPLPAQFLKLLGQASTKDTARLFRYKPVSKWNLEPTQGLDDDFLRWAWPRLEAQDLKKPVRPIAWTPVWRIEQQNGEKVLRYLAADPASNQLCVDCHNGYESSSDIITQRKLARVAPGKQWKLHQLLGALSVTVPLDRIETLAADQIRRAVLWIVAILVSSLALILGAYVWSAKQRRKVAHLSWQATHDALTELINRRGFERSLHRFWISAIEENTAHVLAMIDLDGFKPINDTYGHQAGDEMLKAVSKTIKACLRNSDLVARLGGDEFAVLLHGCPLEHAQEIAEGIRRAIQETQVDWNGHSIGVGASIGLARITSKLESPQDAIEAADAACYVAKKAGKNRVYANEE